MTAFVWARAPVLFLPIGIQHCGDITRRWSRGIRNRGRPDDNVTSTAAFGAQATADAQMGIVGFPPISAVRRSCREGQLRVTTG
jgi:hypothetical protein